ncbi:MAG: hypothetical protein V1755_06620 [Chloroflexota bacterium]
MSKALSEACDVIEALCEMLNDEWKHNNPDLPAPHWPTMAIARKQAKERDGGAIDETPKGEADE